MPRKVLFQGRGPRLLADIPLPVMRRRLRLDRSGGHRPALPVHQLVKIISAAPGHAAQFDLEVGPAVGFSASLNTPTGLGAQDGQVDTDVGLSAPEIGRAHV